MLLAYSVTSDQRKVTHITSASNLGLCFFLISSNEFRSTVDQYSIAVIDIAKGKHENIVQNNKANVMFMV